MNNYNVMFNQIDIEKSITKEGYEKINKAFDFYLVTNDKPLNVDRKVLDSVDFNKNILGVQYTGGNSFILMLKKDDDNESLLKDFRDEYNEENDDGLKFSKLTVPFDKYPHSLLQVMINALAKDDSEDNMSNVTGKLLYFSSRTKSQLFTVEVHLTNDFIVELKGKTFTQTDKPTGKYFTLSNNNILKLGSEKDTKGPFYDEYQFEGQKHLTKFVSTVPSRFPTTKMGILNRVVKAFNDRYEGMARLVFKRENDWETIDATTAKSLKTVHLRKLKEVLKNKTIRIVNGIEDDLSAKIAKEFCESLQKQIIELLSSSKFFTQNDLNINCDIKIDSCIGKDDLNILVLHNKEYYINQNEKDPYMSSDSIVIQHVTLEDYSKTTDEKSKNCYVPNESLVPVILYDLLIKEDLLKPDAKKEISIFDWAEYPITEDMIFCSRIDEKVRDEKTKKLKTVGWHYVFMKIKQDGTFQIEEVKEDSDCSFIDKVTYRKVRDIFDCNVWEDTDSKNYNRYFERFKAVVINQKEQINIVQDTLYDMYPDFELLAKTLEQGKISRKYEDLVRLFLGSIDIHYKETENCAYYSIGDISKGMSGGDFPRATSIRKVIPKDKAPIFWKDLMNTMNVTFVRLGRLTMFPFPFKYISEYANMHHLKFRENK